MADRTIRYYLFHLIKDVSEGTETTRETKDGKRKTVTWTDITKRYFLNLFSWTLRISTWTREELDEGR